MALFKTNYFNTLIIEKFKSTLNLLFHRMNSFLKNTPGLLLIFSYFIILKMYQKLSQRIMYKLILKVECMSLDISY